MNNLKFRAWDKKLKLLGNVSYIDFDSKKMIYHNGFFNYYVNFEDVEIMQSTGLKDKNGVEIFEGDILEVLGFVDWIGVVKYSQEDLSYFFVEYENALRLKCTTLLSVLDKKLEIIGNIYENKELLG